MKKYMLPIIFNLIILIIVPFFMKSQSGAKDVFIGMIVFGNSIYFFIQSQLFSSRNKKVGGLIMINCLFIIAFMLIFLKQIVALYIGFYLIMMVLGIRIGSNTRRINEYKKSKKSD